MSRESLGVLVRQSLIGLGAPELPNASVERLVAWVTQVEEWNRRVDLTAARNERELVDLLLADAIVLSFHVPNDASVVDVGTGAGAPGLYVAGLRPDLRMTLVEPMQKRAALLRMATGAWRDRPGGVVQVVQGRGEEATSRGPFDVAMSRATLPPPEWLRLGTHLAPGGEVWVLLAREPAPTADGWRAVDTISYEWPLTNARRALVRYRNS